MKEKLQSLKRLIPTLSEEEAKVVVELFNNGEKTGYATVDRPWDNFYENIKKNTCKDFSYCRYTASNRFVSGNANIAEQ